MAVLRESIWTGEATRYLVCAICVLLTCVVTGHQVWSHLVYYHSPELQKYVIRIVLMVPVYAVTSFISLSMESLTVAYYFQAVREIYEAYVLYNFVELLLSYMGGADVFLERAMEDGKTTRSCLGYLQGWLGHSNPQTVPVDNNYFRHCMIAIIQFILLRGLYTLIEIFLDVTGVLQTGPLGSDTGYMVETAVFNVSVTIAVFALGFFFFAAEEYLEGFRPIPKFLLVKSIIFVTFWQGAVISVVLRFTVNASDASGDQKITLRVISQQLQDYLICVECLPAAIANHFGFLVSDFQEEGEPRTSPFRGVGHVMNHSDLMESTEEHFKEEAQELAQATNIRMPDVRKWWLFGGITGSSSRKLTRQPAMRSRLVNSLS